MRTNIDLQMWVSFSYLEENKGEPKTRAEIWEKNIDQVEGGEMEKDKEEDCQIASDLETWGCICQASLSSTMFKDKDFKMIVFRSYLEESKGDPKTRAETREKSIDQIERGEMEKDAENLSNRFWPCNLRVHMSGKPFFYNV